jgi:hypothetical protein
MNNKKKFILEDLKRYKQLLEYTFYVPEEKEEDLDGDLLLDDSFLTEQDPAGDDPFMDVADPEGGDTETEEPAGQAPAGDEPVGDEEPAGQAPVGDEPVEDEEPEIEDEFADTEGIDGTSEDEDTVEVDVTDLVDNTEETKKSVSDVSDKMEELLSKLSELENQITGMDEVISKIDSLEKEIEKRNPTPVERLEMRSMQDFNFPYSVKLKDFWSDKEGYEATNDSEEEYILRQSDVENFDRNEIKASFDSPKKDKN